MLFPAAEQATALKFLQTVNRRFNLDLRSYHDLYTWSTSYIDLFWTAVWDETDVIGFRGSHVVDTHALPADNPSWFSEARLNWAENMLRCRSPDKVALIQISPLTFIPLL